MVYYNYYKTKIGIIKIGFDDKLREISLVDKIISKNIPSTLADFFAQQINLYLDGKLKTFKRLDLISPRGTSFQKSVWQALLKIPYGSKISYKNLAREIESPKAYRAVGTAVGKNPLLIIIPCHRVIKADESLGEFAYGPDLKNKLLEIEKKFKK